MEKNNLTFIWEGRGGSNEPKIAVPGPKEKLVCKEWMWLGKGAGAFMESWGSWMP